MKMAKASERDMEQNTTKERPILFSGAMVRAILSGQKTQTRRCMKPQPYLTPEWDSERQIAEFYMADECVGTVTCPYGQPGDRLWVREAWRYNGWHPVDTARANVGITYRADGESTDYIRDDFDYEQHVSWRPSIHMPRWACRIVLEIVSVRVERLNDISESDCWAEGIERSKESPAQASSQFSDYASPRAAYMHLWESINGPESWNANPWVWVVEFRKVPA